MTADVVVVGGGIIGAATAHQLLRRTRLRLVVLDKAPGPGAGSTGASSAISRCRYTHPDVIRLALCGQRAYRDWGEFTGLERPRSRLHQVGVLWMLGQSRREVEADADRLSRRGVEVEVLTPADLADRWPALSPCGERVDPDRPELHECRPGEAFLFEPTGGYADPVGAVQDLHDAIRRRGGEVRFNAVVTGIRRSGDRVVGVEVNGAETIQAGLVINAAGPWCNRLNLLAGVNLEWRLTPTRIQTLVRGWPADLGPLPVGADSSTGIYFRPELPGRVVVGSVLPEDEEEEVEDPDHFKTHPDPDFRTLKMAAFHHRVPGLAAKGDVGGIAGLYTINREDVHPVLGPTGVDGYWVANGFSGHGFKLAPPVGALIAREWTGVELPDDPDVPLSLLAVDRRPIEVAAKHVLA